MKAKDYITNVLNGVEGEKGDLLRALLEATPTFWTAPASSSKSRHHGWNGGLSDHCANMLWIAANLEDNEVIGNVVRESVIIAIVLHDISKATDMHNNPKYVPNILKKGNVSEAKPFEIEKEKWFKTQEGDALPAWRFLLDNCSKFTDGEQSLAVVKHLSPKLFDLLTPDEVQAIRYHDLGYGKAKYELNGDECALTIFVHYLDMLSSRIYGSQPKFSDA